MMRALAQSNPLGGVLLAAGLLLLALSLIRYLREEARLRALRGDALAIYGVTQEPRTPLLGPAVVLVAIGLVLLRGWR